MQTLHNLAKAWSVDRCQHNQCQPNNHDNYNNNILVHFIFVLIFVSPTYKYASASRTVSPEAWEAGARVASAAPSMTRAVQTTTPHAEIWKGVSTGRDRLPLSAAVRSGAGIRATTQLTTAVKMPSSTTSRRTLEADAPIALITPNSRVRSSTLVLIVEANPENPTTLIPMERARKTRMRGSI